MTDTIIEIDTRGDIQLNISEPNSKHHAIFKACSRTLSRTSPVFDRMLYGNFIESKASKDWKVNLPHDKAISMEHYLSITHANFRNVPQVLPVEQLYDLTVLTHYYDTTHLLFPWAQTWMDSIRNIANDANVLMPKLLWISWELGCREIFEKTVDRMLMESESSWSEVICQLEDVQMPPDIIERIDAIRVQTIQALLSIFSDMIDHLIVVDERPRWCRHATWMGPHRCESMILGSITFCLARAGLWPLPDVQDMEYSVLGLYKKLTNLVIHDIGPEVAGKPSKDHRACNPEALLLERVKRVMDEIPNPMMDFHIEHLKTQAKKLQM